MIVLPEVAAEDALTPRQWLLIKKALTCVEQGKPVRDGMVKPFAAGLDLRVEYFKPYIDRRCDGEDVRVVFQHRADGQVLIIAAGSRDDVYARAERRIAAARK